MPHALRTRVVIARSVGEIDAVAAGKLAFLYGFALFYLQPCGGAEKFIRAEIKHILRERRTIERVYGEAALKIARAVVQAHRAEHVRRAEKFIRLCQYPFHGGVIAFFQREFFGVRCGKIYFFAAVIHAVPVSRFFRHRIRSIFFRRSHRFVAAARARTEIHAAARADYVQLQILLRLRFFGFRRRAGLGGLFRGRRSFRRIARRFRLLRGIGRFCGIIRGRFGRIRGFGRLRFALRRRGGNMPGTICRGKRICGKNGKARGKNQRRGDFHAFHLCCLRFLGLKAL